MFDFKEYLFTLTRQNRLAATLGYHPCLCSGIQGIEGVLESLQDHDRFIMLDDTTDGHTEQLPSGGWFTRRVLTVFILATCDFADTRQRLDRLNECRAIFRQFHARMIRDEEQLLSDLMYLDVAHVRYRELGTTFADGLTGLYFMIDLREPTDLRYLPDDWTDTPTHTFDTTFTAKYD